MTALGHPNRKYPETKLGDTFGDRTVVALVPRVGRSRSDELVRWRCVCGVTGKSYVFNLRGRAVLCRHKESR